MDMKINVSSFDELAEANKNMKNLNKQGGNIHIGSNEDDLSPFSQYMEQNQFLEYSLHEIVTMSRKENESIQDEQ